MAKSVNLSSQFYGNDGEQIASINTTNTASSLRAAVSRALADAMKDSSLKRARIGRIAMSAEINKE